jgi:hypothetical protein
MRYNHCDMEVQDEEDEEADTEPSSRPEQMAIKLMTP